MPSKKSLCIIGLSLFVAFLFIVSFYKSNSLSKIKDLNSSSSVIKNKSSKAELGNTKQSQDNNLVVDQTLGSLNKKNAVKQYEKKVLGSIDNKIEVEVTLLDGEKNQILRNYDVEYFFSGLDNLKRVSCKTNDNGIFKITIDQTNEIRFIVSTKDFADNLNYLKLHYGVNDYTVKLYACGNIEIKAINTNGEIVKDLKCYQVNDLVDGYIHWEPIFLYFDSIKEIYIIKKSPLGHQRLFFNATGYQQTSLYTINIFSKKVNKLEIILLPKSKLYFDLEIPIKPESIKIIKPKVFHDDGFVRLQNNINVVKNKHGLYEFDLDDNQLKSLIVSVENYFPALVDINLNKSIYKVSLFENFNLKLIVVDEKDVPIKNAIVSYKISKRVTDEEVLYFIYGAINPKNGYIPLSLEKIEEKVLTDEKGEVTLKGLYHENELEIKITHLDYRTFVDENWFIDSRETSSKTIVLVKSKQISGYVKFGDNFVAGATIILENNFHTIMSSISDINGKFLFNLPIGVEKTDYFLTAFHTKFGTESIPINIESDNKIIDLELKNELSCDFKLIDTNGQPFANKKIILIEENGIDDKSILKPLSFSFFTNSKGEGKVYNLPANCYKVIIPDGEFYLDELIVIPTNNLELTVNKKDLRLLKINFATDSIKTENIKISGIGPFGRSFNIKTCKIKEELFAIFESEDYYFDILEISFIHYILFEAPDFVGVKFGPFEEGDRLPSEFQVNFQKGYNLKVIVIDSNEIYPLKGISVHIYTSGNILVNSLPTNGKGEVEFNNLNGEYLVKINEPFHTEYSCKVIINKNEDMSIGLLKGGNLKLHFKLPEDYFKMELFFDNDLQIPSFYSDGILEAFNLNPGTCKFYIRMHDTNGNQEDKRFQAKLLIENNKTLEVNLDDLNNNKNTLTVIVKNNNNELIQDAILTLYNGSKYQLEDVLQGQVFCSDNSGEIIISLLPKIKYYFTLEVESDFQMILIEPFELQLDENKSMECIFSASRESLNIKVINTSGEPLDGASFIYKDEKGNFLTRNNFSGQNGFINVIGLPKGNVNLIIGRKGYEFKEIVILENQPKDQLIQVILSEASSIRIVFQNILKKPISIGILNQKGELLQLPVDCLYHGTTDLSNYFSDIRIGNHVFSNLTAGTYYIGYYHNRTKTIISKQGPFIVGGEEQLVINSNFQLDAE